MQAKEDKKKRMDIEGDIIKHLSEIKSLSDSGASLIDKGGRSNEDDISKAFDLSDQIFEKLDVIRDLLFELEDTLEVN